MHQYIFISKSEISCEEKLISSGENLGGNS